MSAYIDIGFVYYKGKEELEKDIILWSNNLYEHCKQISYKTFVDVGQKNFRFEVNSESELREVFLGVYSGRYIDCELMYTYNSLVFNLLFSIEYTEDNQYGIIFSIQDYELFGENMSSDNVNDITKAISLQLDDLCKKYNFKYAYCDCEASIEYSIEEIELIEKNTMSKYSIVVINNNHVGRIMENNWCIDGITTRVF